MKTLPLVYCLLFLALFSCKRESPPIIDTNYLDNPINWANPQPDQQTFYVNYTSACDTFEKNVFFNRDTLVLKVLSNEGELYLAESFTIYSPIYASGTTTGAVIYPFTHKDGVIEIEDRSESYLFNFVDIDEIPYNPDSERYFTQKDCRVWPDTILNNQPVFSETIFGKINSFNVGDFSFGEMAIASFYIGPHGFLMFDENEMVVSHYIQSENIIKGWIKIN